jgi:polycomb protein EED
VHGNYVDCIRWLGDLLLSKSVDDRILLWSVDLQQNQKNKNSLESVDFLQVGTLHGPADTLTHIMVEAK